MDFRQAEERFRFLEQALRAGQIAPAEYRKQLERLVVIDTHGARWQMQERTGKWFILRDGRWQEAEPPAAAGQPPAVTAQKPAAAAQKAFAAGRQAQTAQPTQTGTPKRRRWLLAAAGLLGACLACSLLAGAGWIAYPYLLPKGAELPELPVIALPDEVESQSGAEAPSDPAAPPEARVQPGEMLAVPADGASHSDGNGASLAVPAQALSEGGQAQLSANTVEGGWAAALEKHYSIDTPFYSVAALGKEDSAGRLSLTLPAPSPDSRVLAVIDGEHLALFSEAPRNGTITLEVRAGPSAPETAPEAETQGPSSLTLYAVVTPRQPAGRDGSIAPVRLNRAPDGRSCTPVLDAAYQLVSYCRQSPDGSIVVEVPGSQMDRLSKVDTMVDRISEVMVRYAGFNFNAAKLSPGSPMIVRVFTGAGDPTYKPLNGVLYMPVDAIDTINSGTPHDLYHEIAHWIQDEEYFTIYAFYSEQRTWWLETAAENMVMLLDESYLGKNLTTYGTIQHNGHQIALQAGPNQWPNDFYVHAQMVKLNMCDGAACPLSQASFAEAINQGAYPFQDSARLALLNANLDDYARYLLGKAPQQANSAILLSGPVATGEGYGEWVNLTTTRNTDFNIQSNGYKPQMRPETEGGREVFVIEASLEKNGVYPLSVKGAEAKYAAIPAKLTIQPGAPFWYTIDNGEPIFSDGSQELVIQPIHSQMGYSRVRLVALGKNGGETLRARVEPLDLGGVWVVTPEKEIANNITCTGDSDGESDPAAGTAALSSALIYLISGMGDMQPEASGRGLDWSLVAARLPAEVDASEFSYQASALQTAQGVRYQARLSLPQPESSRDPTGLGIGMAVMIFPVWLARRDRKRAVLALALAALLIGMLSGCGAAFAMYGTADADITHNRVSYIGGQEAGTVQAGSPPQGEPLWKMSGQATYNINLTSVLYAVVMDEETEKTSVCSGSVTYEVTTYIYKDIVVVLNDSNE